MSKEHIIILSCVAHFKSRLWDELRHSAQKMAENGVSAAGKVIVYSRAVDFSLGWWLFSSGRIRGSLNGSTTIVVINE